MAGMNFRKVEAEGHNERYAEMQKLIKSFDEAVAVGSYAIAIHLANQISMNRSAPIKFRDKELKKLIGELNTKAINNKRVKEENESIPHYAAKKKKDVILLR